MLAKMNETNEQITNTLKQLFFHLNTNQTTHAGRQLLKLKTFAASQKGVCFCIKLASKFADTNEDWSKRSKWASGSEPTLASGR